MVIRYVSSCLKLIFPRQFNLSVVSTIFEYSFNCCKCASLCSSNYNSWDSNVSKLHMVLASICWLNYECRLVCCSCKCIVVGDTCSWKYCRYNTTIRRYFLLQSWLRSVLKQIYHFYIWKVGFSQYRKKNYI